MFLDWWHKFRNPHCPHCIEEKREARVCNTCEVLQLQVAKLQYENEKLLSKIFEKPAEEPKIDTNDLKPIMPKTMPWNVRRQMMEREDRHKAKLLKQQGEGITVEELEQEMAIVEQEREG